MTLVLDSGALIALERNDRAMWTRLKSAALAGSPPISHAGVVGQVWRGTPRQARLAQALRAIDVQPIDEALARRAGVLLRDAGLAEVVDACVVLLAADGDEIVTLDHDDLSILAAAAGRDIELIRP